MLGFREYLGYAEKYVMLAEDEIGRSSDASWLLIPATVLAWAAVESFVNNILDDFGSLPEDLFELHERAFLLERRIRFMDSGDRLGEFALEGTEYQRLENKIFFLVAKFSTPGARNIKGATLWHQFQEFKETRDGLVHPRRGKEILLGIEKVNEYIGVARAIIELVSQHVWSRQVDF
jgi:hypothetical protein